MSDYGATSTSPEVRVRVISTHEMVPDNRLGSQFASHLHPNIPVDPNPYIRCQYHSFQRTGGLVWIWRQPPKLQAGGSNPLPFANLLVFALGFSLVSTSDHRKSVISPIHSATCTSFVTFAFLMGSLPLHTLVLISVRSRSPLRSTSPQWCSHARGRRQPADTFVQLTVGYPSGTQLRETIAQYPGDGTIATVEGYHEVDTPGP